MCPKEKEVKISIPRFGSYTASSKPWSNDEVSIPEKIGLAYTYIEPSVRNTNRNSVNYSLKSEIARKDHMNGLPMESRNSS